MSAKRKKKKKQARQHRKKPGALIFTSFNVTYEPITSGWEKKVPQEILDRQGELMERSYEKPRKAITELIELIKKYPDVPVFYNYLTNAYINVGNTKEAYLTNLECLSRFPDYLFAKTNHAIFCLRKGNVEEIPRIFNNRFNLKALYPGRSTFHITEVVSFMSVMGMYFYAINECDIAEDHYRTVRKLDPDHPLTIQLEDMLHPGPRFRFQVDPA